MQNKGQISSSYLTDDELSKWEDRLINIMLFNQSRYKLDGDVEIERRKEESRLWGSLCLKPDALLGEEWCEYPDNNAFSVSSYGRVRCEHKLVPQKDEAKESKGYLILDKEKFEQKFAEKISRQNLPNYVYQMVAITFMGKKIGDRYHIHHITNNGYDNSIGNLICLTAEQHGRVEAPVWSTLKKA